MDEITRRALEQFREAESSAIGINRRRMLDAIDATQTAQARAALEAFKSVETIQSRAAMEAFRSFEAIQSRAVLDVIRNMPDLSRSALDAMKNLSDVYSGVIDQAIRATPFLDAMRESENQIASLFRHEHTGALDAIRTATESFKFDAVQRVVSTFDRLNLLQLGSIAGSAGLAALSFTNPALESVFSSDSFARLVADSVRSILQTHTFDASAFEGLEELIEEKIAELPGDKVTAQGLYRIIFEIVLVLLAVGADVGGTVYQVHVAKQLANEQNKQQIAIEAKEDARSAQWREFLKQIAENTAKLVPEKDSGKYYLVEREVVLRVKPQPKTPKIVVLFPNQRVLLVKDNHKWIYIEYFDYLEGVPRYGWAMKKYFRRTD
jgi:hypothetical protein